MRCASARLDEDRGDSIDRILHCDISPHHGIFASATSAIGLRLLRQIKMCCLQRRTIEPCGPDLRPSATRGPWLFPAPRSSDRLARKAQGAFIATSDRRPQADSLQDAGKVASFGNARLRPSDYRDGSDREDNAVAAGSICRCIALTLLSFRRLTRCSGIRAERRTTLSTDAPRSGSSATESRTTFARSISST